MKNVLFATTATAALLVGGVASAQGIALFGDARLGLGYNIFNDGSVRTETNADGTVDTPDDLRAISRVRFGVNMTGETDSGITFGATIRADNSGSGEEGGGQGGTLGQTAGSVFVSGSWGTLTYGELRESCRRVAAYLARHGLQPGTHVSLVMPNGLATLRMASAEAKREHRRSLGASPRRSFDAYLRRLEKSASDECSRR